MHRALLFIAEHRRAFTLFVTLFLSVSMMIMGESSKTRLTRAVTTALFNTGRFTFSWGIYLTDLWRENKRLRLENLELSEKVYYADFALKENERLRRLLKFKEEHLLSDSVIVANVIGHDVDRIVNSIVLDVGSKDGVKKNMAVVTAEGLVGNVFEVYPSSSGIQIIKDINARVSAVVEGINGIIQWEGGSYLRMYGLPLNTSIETGKKVYTTGFGGVYPGGILIGTVSPMKRDDVNRYASVNVEPAVDFSRVQEVFLLAGSERSDIWDDGDGMGHFHRSNLD